ncbi:MAG: ABC transporter ATP-binding protein [Oscillospiraceae bacterium]|jgi:ATP-binding cassette subfamily B multidrug efflux pump|nr:ABC transporter ATP-binding protein [Oscillospiraceae bacterium]
MMKKLWPYTRGYRKWIIFGVLCSAGEAVFELLLPLVMADIVDTGIPSGDTAYILTRGALMVCMALVSMSLGIGAAFLSARAGQGFGANLRRAQYDHIQEFSFRNIEKFSTASLVTRLTNDCNNLQMSLMMAMRLMVRAPVMLISALVLAVTISLKLSRVFLVALPLLAVLIGLIIKHISPVFGSLQEATDGVNLAVQENLSAIRVVKSFVREDYEEEKFKKRNDALRSISEKAFGFVVMNMPVMMLITYGTIIAVMWYGAPLVQAGELEVGLLSTFFTYITQVLISLMMVSMIMMMITRTIACGKRVAEVLEEVPDIADETAGASLQAADGSVDFEHVYFKYNPEAEKWNLRDIDLHIPSGATVGIIGATGSAKSTLVQLIPRLYEAQEGTVRVGGRPVKDYTMEHLRDAVAMVLQKNTLFSGTIRENLLWGDADATDAEIEAACEAACASEFIRRMPDGYNTDLGQGGVNVSGGQKQRLCIARAILKKPKVLILDDSTSAVDTATDAKIRAAFRTQLPDTTKIIIAQRIISVMDADLIVVMDDGGIADVGTHAELMETSEIYRDVYQSQQEGASIDG